MQGTTGDGYVNGDGSIILIPPGERGRPVELTGESLDGKPLDVTTYRGKPLVVNVWGSWCAPCHAEAKLLVDADAELGSTAAFLGITSRDSDTSAPKAYNAEYGVTYPSIFDKDGQALLAFRGRGAPTGTPSTLVLDDRGRVAAAISGPVPTQQTLVDIVDQVATGA